MAVDPGKLHQFVNKPSKPVFGKGGGGGKPFGKDKGGGGKPFGKGGGGGGGPDEPKGDEGGEHDDEPKGDAVTEAVKKAGAELEDVLNDEVQELSLDAEPDEELVGRLQSSLTKLGEAGVAIKNAAKGLSIDDAHNAAEEAEMAGLTENVERLAAWLFFIGKLADVGG